MTKLSGKRMVITGSSRSLGRHFALACAQQGASLVLNGTNAQALAGVEQECKALGADVRAVAGSVAETATCRALVQTCVEAFGGIDVLVNNAGIVRDRTLLNMTDEEFDEVIAVDLRGPFLCMREAARAMKEQGSGHIIQITSASGLVGNFGQANYAAAKAGLMGMMYTAVKEFARYNIRVNALWPIARTDMTQAIIDKAGKSARELGFGEPQDVANALVWLASESAARFNAQCMTCNGNKTALWRSPTEESVLHSSEPLTFADLDNHYRDVEPITVYSTR